MYRRLIKPIQTYAPVVLSPIQTYVWVETDRSLGALLLAESPRGGTRGPAVYGSQTAMPTNTSARDKSRVTTGESSVDDRTRRALEECMSVLSDVGRAADVEDLYIVIGENGGDEYLVDVRKGRCSCPDSEYRDPNGGCKHVRRARMATGEAAIPAAALTVDDVTVDDHFGDHVTGDVQVAAADGGIILEGSSDNGTEFDTSASADVWSAPQPEIDKHGVPTGDHFVECLGCGVEVLTSLQEFATHRDGCPHADGGHDEPTRHEPADFGGGESTGVQTL